MALVLQVYAERILTYTDISKAVTADGSLTSSDAELGQVRVSTAWSDAAWCV